MSSSIHDVGTEIYGSTTSESWDVPEPDSASDSDPGPDFHDLLGEIEELRSQLQFLQVQNEFLLAEVKGYKEKIESLEKEVNKLQENEKKIKTDADEVKKSLQKQIHDLKEELENFKKGSDMLYVSQAACLFEQAICTYVMPDVFSNDKFATIKQLLNYLNGGFELPLEQGKVDEQEILCTAKKRWSEMCEILQLPNEWKKKAGSWKPADRTLPDVIRAIGILKRERIPVAHPKFISLTSAEEKVKSDSIKHSLSTWQFNVVRGFFGSLRNLVLQETMHTDFLHIIGQLNLKLD